MMYRVIAIVIGALALAACSSTPDWMSLDGLKPGPVTDTVRFESEPPGAEAKIANGQSCRTPCALPIPSNAPATITFTLAGYQPVSETIEPVTASNGLPELRPNPVQIELTPAPPPKPVKKRPVRKPATAKKPAAAKKPATASTPAPVTAAPAQQSTAPWPATPPAR